MSSPRTPTLRGGDPGASRSLCSPARLERTQAGVAPCQPQFPNCPGAEVREGVSGVLLPLPRGHLVGMLLVPLNASSWDQMSRGTRRLPARGGRGSPLTGWDQKPPTPFPAAREWGLFPPAQAQTRVHLPVQAFGAGLFTCLKIPQRGLGNWHLTDALLS